MWKNDKGNFFENGHINVIGSKLSFSQAERFCWVEIFIQERFNIDVFCSWVEKKTPYRNFFGIFCSQGFPNCLFCWFCWVFWQTHLADSSDLILLLRKKSKRKIVSKIFFENFASNFLAKIFYLNFFSPISFIIWAVVGFQAISAVCQPFWGVGKIIFVLEKWRKWLKNEYKPFWPLLRAPISRHCIWEISFQNNFSVRISHFSDSIFQRYWIVIENAYIW